MESKAFEKNLAPLDDTNYAPWSKQMQWYLTTKKLWTVVKSGVKPGTRSAEEANRSPEHDEEALAQIGLNVTAQHHDTVFSAASAKHAWEALAATYAAKSFGRKMQLRKAMFNLSKDPTESLAQYVARATSLRTQLSAIGMTVAETEVCWAILTGLPEEYEMIATLLETSNEELQITDVVSKLQTVEQRIRQQPQQAQENAYAARFSSPSQKVCWYCDKPGHVMKHCLKKQRDERADGAAKHLAARCSIAM